MTNDMKKNDQDAFWVSTIEGISGHIDASSMEHNVIMLDRGIICDFGNADMQVAMEQIYKLGNSVPPYSQTWDGTPQDNFFRTYQEILNNIDLTPTDPDPALKKQLDDLMAKHLEVTNQANGILRNCIKEYMTDYCMEKENDYICSVPLPGSPTLHDYLQNEYQPKFEAIAQDYGIKMDDLEQSIRTLRKKIYGDDVEQLDEAIKVLQYADPNNVAGINMANRDQYLMKVNDNGTVMSVPKFSFTNLDDYKKWYTTIKADFDNNAKPSVEVTLTDKDYKTSETQWELTTKATIPVSWFFQVNESTKTDYQKLEMSKYNFQASLAYQDVMILNVQPDQSWFYENLLHTYNDTFVNSTNTTFKGKTINGPDGILPIRVKGLIIGVGESLKMEVSNWSSTDIKKSWDASASFGIGPIHFASTHTKGHTHTHEVKETDSGIEVRDAHGIPKIIGALVEKY